MKKKFRRKKNIKWMMPFGKIYQKNRRYTLQTVGIEDNSSNS
ncbi:MAG: hypothetical protein WBM43_11635 [Flavobacteriaceae bacterium]